MGKKGLVMVIYIRGGTFRGSLVDRVSFSGGMGSIIEENFLGGIGMEEGYGKVVETRKCVIDMKECLLMIIKKDKENLCGHLEIII